MMNRKISWLLGLLCTSFAYGQEFTYEAAVAPISETGYYRIALSPDLLGKLRLDRADLRLYNVAGREQPYLLRQESEISYTSLFQEYEIVNKAYKKDAISYLIFSNPEKKAIDNVSFIVKNTDVQKRARLSGSEDQKNWYVIKNNYLLHSMQNDEETTELKILNFPLSDYAYFKLEIDDNWRLPINILKVGYYDTQKIKGLRTIVDGAIVERKDSLKTSYLKVEFSDQKYLEKLRFDVSGADYYSRYTTVQVKKERINRKKRRIEYLERVGSFDLNSNSTNELDFRGISTDALYIEIQNRDNAPLKIDKIEGSYLNRYLVAKLEPQERYVLKFGNETLRSPDYDMARFSDQIPQDAKKISHDAVESLLIPEVEEERGILDSPYLIWLVIGVVGVGLAFVSLKMVKEIGTK